MRQQPFQQPGEPRGCSFLSFLLLFPPLSIKDFSYKYHTLSRMGEYTHINHCLGLRASDKPHSSIQLLICARHYAWCINLCERTNRLACVCIPSLVFSVCGFSRTGFHLFLILMFCSISRYPCLSASIASLSWYPTHPSARQ